MPIQPEETENSTNSVGSIVDETVAKEPQVDETVLDELQSREKETETHTDSNGQTSFIHPETPKPKESGFDPAVHRVDDSGNPVRNKDGSFQRKRGRKPGQTGTQSGTSGNANANPNPSPNASPRVDYTALGQMLAGITFGGAVSVFGPAWQPSDFEKETITQNYAATLEYYGITDIPAPIMLIVALGMYALPRLSDPETQKRIQSMRDKWNGKKKVENQA